MFEIDSDMTLHVTRGDVAFFTVTAEKNEGLHKFQPNDVVRIKVTKKKDSSSVAFQKEFLVLEETDMVDIVLTEAETKIGDVISKPVDYWYEVELNPYTNPQTIIGYDADGPKILKLYPEGRDLGPGVESEDIPVVDKELSFTSERPIQNQAVTRALVGYEGVALAEQKMKEETEKALEIVGASSEVAVESATKAESAAKRAEDAAGVAQAVAEFEIDTEINKDSYNPIANKAVAEYFENRPVKNNKFSTESDVDKYYEDIHNNALDGSFYEGRCQHNVAHSILGGGQFYVYGVKFFEGYGWQKIISYEANTPREYERSIVNGVWTEWTKPLTTVGGEVTGMFKAKTSSEYPLRVENTNARSSYTAYYGTDGGWLGALGFNTSTPSYRDTSGGTHELLHTGNKPTGTYTGNGDATSRTINVGGVGNVLYVWSENGNAVIMPTGGFVSSPSIGVTRLTSNEARFANGVLTLATANVVVNANGTKTEYQVA